MKKKNAVSDFTSERNAMLLAHFRKQLALQSQITVDKAFKGAADSAAPRFWVSETRAAVVIGRMLKEGENAIAGMYEEKKEMYREIFRRVKELKKEMPDAPVCDLVWEVVNQPAPKSYMSWQRAKRVIYAKIKSNREERKAAAYLNKTVQSKEILR